MLGVARQCVRIDLADDQRNLVVIAKLRCVVDDNGARSGGAWCMKFRHGTASRKERNVDAVKIEFGKICDRDRFAIELNAAAGRSRAGQGNQFCDREFSFGEDRQQGLANCTSGADDGDDVARFLAHSIPVGVCCET